MFQRRARKFSWGRMMPSGAKRHARLGIDNSMCVLGERVCYDGRLNRNTFVVLQFAQEH